jgi:hypothetical protein
MALGGHDRRNDKVDSHAEHSSNKQEQSPTDAINDWKHDACGNQENHILDGG